MRYDCSFCLEYCWCYFNVLFSGYGRKSSVFYLKYFINFDIVADTAFVHWNQTFVNNILSTWFPQNSKILIESFYFLWQYSYLLGSVRIYIPCYQGIIGNWLCNQSLDCVLLRMRLIEHRQNILWCNSYKCLLRLVSQGNRNKNKNKQMEPNQTYKFFLRKGNFLRKDNLQNGRKYLQMMQLTRAYHQNIQTI